MLSLNDDGSHLTPPYLPPNAVYSRNSVAFCALANFFYPQEHHLIFFCSDDRSEFRFETLELFGRKLTSKKTVLDRETESRADLVNTAKTPWLTDIVRD